MKREVTALLKDLHMQIDYLVGYAPQGLHWKKEYYFREKLISDTLTDPATPQETVDKINRIYDAIYRLQKKQKHEQPYFNHAQKQFKTPRKPVIVTWQGNIIETFTLEDPDQE